MGFFLPDLLRKEKHCDRKEIKQSISFLELHFWQSSSWGRKVTFGKFCHKSTSLPASQEQLHHVLPSQVQLRGDSKCDY